MGCALPESARTPLNPVRASKPPACGGARRTHGGARGGGVGAAPAAVSKPQVEAPQPAPPDQTDFCACWQQLQCVQPADTESSEASPGWPGCTVCSTSVVSCRARGRDRQRVGHAGEVARSGQQLLRGSSAPAAAMAGQQGDAHGLQVHQARRCLSAPCRRRPHPGRPAPPARASPGRRRTLARSACARALSPGSYAALTVAAMLVCSRLWLAVTARCVCPVRCRRTCVTHMPLGTAPLPGSQSVCRR